MTMTLSDRYSVMELPLEQARLAAAAGEVPVGAAIFRRDLSLVAAAHNQREYLQDPTAHAEMVAIRNAARLLGSWRLIDTILAVTMEPCPMCAGAIVQARIPMVIYGCTDRKAGACDTLYSITNDPRLNHRCEVIGGVRAEECAALLTEFFKLQRALGKK